MKTYLLNNTFKLLLIIFFAMLKRFSKGMEILRQKTKLYGRFTFIKFTTAVFTYDKRVGILETNVQYDKNLTAGSV